MMPFKFPAEKTISEQSAQKEAFNEGYEAALIAARLEKKNIEDTLRKEYEEKIKNERNLIAEALTEKKSQELSEMMSLWLRENKLLDFQLGEEVFFLIEQVVRSLLSDDVIPEVFQIKQLIEEAVEAIQKSQKIDKIELPVEYQPFLSKMADKNKGFTLCFSEHLTPGKIIFHTPQQQHQLNTKSRLDALLESIKDVFSKGGSSY